MKNQIIYNYKKSLSLILDYLQKEKNKNPIFIGIDGRAGSGKTTFANKIKTINPSISVISGDDFYEQIPSSLYKKHSFEYKYKVYFNQSYFIKNILSPISKSKEISYQKYNWEKKSFSECKIFSPTSVVIFEGVFMCSPELINYFDLSIFLEANRDLCLDRLKDRDTPQQWMNDWQDTEDWYFENYKIKTFVDILVDVK